MPKTGSSQGEDEAQRLYQDFLKRLGLEHVTCDACARALMPAPFNLESYTYTARGGPSWTWDVGFAQALVARRPSPAQPQRLDLEQVELWLEIIGQLTIVQPVGRKRLFRGPCDCPRPAD